MTRCLLVGCAVLIACGPKVAKQESYPAIDPPASDTETTLPVPADTHIPASGPLRAGIPQPLVGLPLHVADSTLLLFADEQLEASTMIAKALRAAGLTVEEPKRTREIFDRAARGLSAVTGQACGAGLDRTSAAMRWRAELGTKGRIETAVYCEDSCWIEVNIAEGIDPVLPPRGRTAFYAAPYDIGQPWRTELPKRLGELVAFRSLRDYGPAKLVPGAVPPAVTPDLAFADTNLTIDVPAAVAPATKQCIGMSGAAGLLVETDANDKVIKCEPYARAFDDNRGVVPCVCTALAGRSLGGTGPRRAPVFTRGLDFKVKTTAGLDLNVGAIWEQVRDEASGLFLVKVSHPSIASWSLPSFIVLEACFTTMSEGAIGSNVEVAFDQVGKATSVKLTPMSGSMAMTPAMETCVRDAFMASLGSCPAVPTSIGFATVRATATRP